MPAVDEWNVTFPEARVIQEKLRSQVKLEPLSQTPETIAGVDVSMNRFSNTLFAGWVVMSYPDLIERDRALIQAETKFPYVPGFLSFREIPALLSAYERLQTKPDVTMVDGQGIAHPRRLGIATHLGLALDISTFGCAKSRLYGIGDEPGVEAGSMENLVDGKTNEVIGAYLRTKDRTKPVIISPGHKITLDEALDIARHCVRRHRIPEPTRRAHDMVNAFRRGEIS
jgi:deoxyribonuclease V